MNKLAVMVVTCFFAAFGAGLLAGMVWERQARPATVANIDAGQTVVVPVENPAVVNQNPQVPVVKTDIDTAPPKNNTLELSKEAPPMPPTPPPSRGGPGQPGQPPMDNWLAELKLTPEQSEKMKKIWSDVMKNSFTSRRDKHDAIRKEKDEAIKALFTDEQRKSYENILKTAETKYADLDREGKTSMERAVAMTRELLTPEQVVKYDEFRKKREQMWHRGGRPGGPGGPGGPPDHSPDGGHDNNGRDFNKDGGRDPRFDRRQK